MLVIGFGKREKNDYVNNARDGTNVSWDLETPEAKSETNPPVALPQILRFVLTVNHGKNCGRRLSS